MQEVWSVEQAVTPMGAGLDIVAERTEVFDASPHRRATDAEFLGKLHAGYSTVTGGAKGIQDLCVNAHGIL